MRANPSPSCRAPSILARPCLRLATLALFVLAWGFAPALQTPALQPIGQEDVQVLAHPVAGLVSYLEGQGGNIGVCAGPDGLLIVDSQFENLAPKIQAALDKLSSAPLRFVLNTHFHGDHTGGNQVFGRKAPILAHGNVRLRMSKPRERGGRTEPASPPEALPVVTYEDALTIHFNGEEIEVVHVPSAHTDGDSVVWFKRSNVVHLGDLFFSGRFPFVDLDAGGSVSGLIEQLTALLPKIQGDAKLIPGHGPLSTRADLERYHAMLVETRKIVADALAAGKTAQDIKDQKLLSKYERWSWQFIGTNAFIDILVRDVQAK